MCWSRLARVARLDAGGNRMTGHTLAFTFEGLVIGSLLYSLPFAVQPFATAFGAVDAALLRASVSLGHSPLQTFRRVVIPLSKAGLVTGFTLSFAHTLGEFGVVLMVGGNIPGITRTISIDIYDRCRMHNMPGQIRRRWCYWSFLFLAFGRVWPESACMGREPMEIKNSFVLALGGCRNFFRR